MPRNRNIRKKFITDKIKPVSAEDNRNKHLEGLSEDQKKLIKLMADIFVKAVVTLSKS